MLLLLLLLLLLSHARRKRNELRKKITVTKSDHWFKLQASCLSHVVGFKQGRPGDADLDELAGEIAPKWQELGLRLRISQAKLDEIESNENRKAYRMLLHWRNTSASSNLYGDLYHALCHHRVGLDTVAKQFCGKETTLT